MNQIDNVLITNGLCKDFGGVRAVKNLDITVTKGHIHALIGPNGSGKTTFFNVITGFFPATSGTVIFNSVDITNLKSHAIAKLGISRTFQQAKLAPDLTVLENVLVGMYATTKIDLIRTFLRPPFMTLSQETENRDSAMQLLDSMGIANTADRWAGELVWVERQLVQIARAVAARPKLLLLDEPTGGMGSDESKRVEDIILQIHNNTEITIILVAHDPRLISSIADHVTCIDFGEKIADGTAEQVRSNPVVKKAYLGKGWSSSEDNTES